MSTHSLLTNIHVMTVGGASASRALRRFKQTTSAKMLISNTKPPAPPALPAMTATGNSVDETTDTTVVENVIVVAVAVVAIVVGGVGTGVGAIHVQITNNKHIQIHNLSLEMALELQLHMCHSIK
jgi:hypothetical protein